MHLSLTNALDDLEKTMSEDTRPPSDAYWRMYPGEWQLDIPATPESAGLSLRICQVQYMEPIPAPPEPKPPEPEPPDDAEPSPPPYETHTIVAGDSWWRIANNHGLTVAELQALNHDAVGKTLHPGQVLRVS